MTTIKEITVASIAEPACVKIERNSKGYNYEVSIHADTMSNALAQASIARKQLEAELYGSNPDCVPR